MCDPVSLTIAATAIAAVGTGVSAMSANAQARYQGRVADANAKLANQQAADALERGRIDDRRYQRQLSQQMGEQRAALAANGLDLGFGTPLSVMGDTAVAGAEDVDAIRRNTLNETRGYEINAANYTASARSSRQQATAALVEGGFGIGKTVLGGAQQVSKLRAGQR